MLNTKFNAVIHQIECIKISVMKSLKSIDLSKLLIYHFLGFVTAVHCFLIIRMFKAYILLHIHIETGFDFQNKL